MTEKNILHLNSKLYYQFQNLIVAVFLMNFLHKLLYQNDSDVGQVEGLSLKRGRGVTRDAIGSVEDIRGILQRRGGDGQSGEGYRKINLLK